MKKKDLRLALVCSGGVSLAVYIYGVTIEIWKLVRASRARAEHQTEAGADSEAVYRLLLDRIGSRLDLRVVVDTIAGASAGGINGVMLARALAHDLSLEPLRGLWLEGADVTQLLAEDARASHWSKWLLKPFIRWLTRDTLGDAAGGGETGEMGRKLSLLLRSRWFREPFDGLGLTDRLMQALQAMEAGARPGASLLPPGHALDLLVTLTDFFGWSRRITLYDPPHFMEREHRHMLRFGYRSGPDGGVRSDFTADDIPALAFAARATASYPGLFPPAQLSEIDRLLVQRGQVWAGRADFLSRNFAPYFMAGLDPSRTAFIDGAVLNNRPFDAALAMVQGRPAWRQVDRRLLYIDPCPDRPPPPPDGRPPGFLQVLRGALSDIPRNQPVAEDLAWIERFNERVRRVRMVIEAAEPAIARSVALIMAEGCPQPAAPTPARLAAWRRTANRRAAHEGGFSYAGYIRLKVPMVLDDLATLLAPLVPRGEIRTRLEAWATASGLLPAPGQRGWVTLLRRFDLTFRRRRLRFAIAGINRHYGQGDANGLDRAKGALYGALERLDGRRMTTGWPGDLTASLRQALVGNGDLASALARLGDWLDLAGEDDHTDGLVAALLADPAVPAAPLTTAYLGFAFWDVLTFSVSDWRGLEEFDEIRAIRISPEDVGTLRPVNGGGRLKGAALGHFAAFFSRRHREHDYLWGRLHAIDRLIDLVGDVARLEGMTDLDLPDLKHRAFRAVLAAETPHLPLVADEIARLRADIPT